MGDCNGFGWDDEAEYKAEHHEEIEKRKAFENLKVQLDSEVEWVNRIDNILNDEQKSHSNKRIHYLKTEIAKLKVWLNANQETSNEVIKK
jgi:hypothetical protein